MGQPASQRLLPLAEESLITNDKRDQAAIALFQVDGSHDRGLHSIASPQCGFDLSQLDAKAAYFDLIVIATEKVEAAVRELDGQVAAAEEPAAGEEDREGSVPG